MNDLIAGFEENLKKQLQDLTSQIKSQESQLLMFKEGYLKVQGALELIEAMKKDLKNIQDE